LTLAKFFIFPLYAVTEVVMMEIPENEYKEIEALINSEDSPVGIDAKKTHVIVIHKLMEIEKRLDKIESRLNKP